MTEKELAEIEARWGHMADMTIGGLIKNDIGTLIDEVRRLQRDVESLDRQLTYIIEG